jgi:23S rRNA (cytidine2498-2'-O)-methyltransferase
MLASEFLFAVCQVGSEALLKKEVSREHPALKLAFSRPGFITWKGTALGIGPSFELRSVFARAHGMSSSKLAPNEATKITDLARALQQDTGRTVRLDVFERDRFAPGAEPADHVPGHAAAAARSSILEAMPEGWSFRPPEDKIAAGDPVIDVVLVEDDTWWLGAHLFSADHSPFVGGRPEIVLPEGAPSRAFLKIEEALAWSGLPVRNKDVALEIGSAPGGAAFALLERGLEVVGIDPAEMDARVRAARGFRHLRARSDAVSEAALPRTVHWILLDMNSEPDKALAELERIVKLRGEDLLGVILTLKLNQRAIADAIPDHLERVRAMGFEVRARQLFHNRREYTVVGLTARGELRRKGGAH